MKRWKANIEATLISPPSSIPSFPSPSTHSILSSSPSSELWSVHYNRFFALLAILKDSIASPSPNGISNVRLLWTHLMYEINHQSDSHWSQIWFFFLELRSSQELNRCGIRKYNSAGGTRIHDTLTTHHHVYNPPQTSTYAQTLI